MINTITIQIQLEPNKPTDDTQMMICKEMMLDVCSTLEKMGYVRCEIYKDNLVWTGSDENTEKIL